MQARWMTASQPASALRTSAGLRRSPLTWLSFAVAVEVGENLAVNVEIEDRDLIAGVEQLGHEIRTDVTRPAGHQDTLEPISHHAFRFL